MDGEINTALQNIKDYINDSSQKTHKMLIDNLSSLTIFLDRDQISQKEQFEQISEIVISLINYNYVGKKTNLELIVRLLSQMVLRLGNKVDYSTYTTFLKKVLAVLASNRQKSSARQIASNIIFCILKNKHEITNFPTSVLKEIFEVVYKILSNTKEEILIFLSLNILNQLIKNDSLKDGCFFDLAEVLFGQMKDKNILMMIAAVKCLSQMFHFTKEPKLLILKLRKLQKRLADKLREDIRKSEFRRNVVHSYFECILLIFWTERNVDHKKRALDENLASLFIEECFGSIRSLLAEGEQNKWLIYNCFELLILCIEKTRLHIKQQHLKAIIDMIVCEASRINDARLYYTFRDVFGYFFEKLLYFVPERMAIEVYDQITDRLMNFKHKISHREDTFYWVVTRKPLESMGPVAKLLTEIYLKTWYRVLKVFGSEVQEHIQDHQAVLSLVTSYLFSSDSFIQNASIHCLIVYCGLSLECLDRTMSTLIELRDKLTIEAESLTDSGTGDKPDRERLALVLHKVTALSRAIGTIVSRYHKDFFELSRDYILNLLNTSMEQIVSSSKNFCSESLKINLGEVHQILKAVLISNGFWMIANILHMKQKWVHIHLSNLVNIWKNLFLECKLVLPSGTKPEENHLGSQILINYVYSIMVFLKNCPLIGSEGLSRWFSQVIIQIYKNNFVVEVEIEALDKVLLKTLTFEICNMVDMKFLKPIINNLNSTCFNDLMESCTCFHKVPSFLLDEEEVRLIRIFLAEGEYYTIAFPDSLEMNKLERDNVELKPYYFPENTVVMNTKTTHKKLLSKAQIKFVGLSFQSKFISRNNKINILQFILRNLEEVLPLRSPIRNIRATPFLLTLLSIVNSMLEAKAQGQNLEELDWDSEIMELFLQIVQKCWSLDDIMLRLTCGIIYAKSIKLAEPSLLAKCADNLLKYKQDMYQMPTIIISLGFMYKYCSIEALSGIQIILSNILADASRSRENEISSNRFLFIAISLGFKYNGEKFLPIFKQIFPFLMLHYLEVANSDQFIYWAMSEWMGVYLTKIVGRDEKKLGADLKTILFDHYRTTYNSSFPIVSYARFNLMKAIFQCPFLANSYSCFKSQETAILAKLKKENGLKKSFFRESEIADMDAAELLIHSLHRIKITGLEISFIILNNLNNLNYQLLCSEEVKNYLKNTYQNTLKSLVDNNNVKMEEILFFYQSALSPTNHAFAEGQKRKEDETEDPGNSGANFVFSRPILSDTQDFINYTFENLLKNIIINKYLPHEILEFSSLVFPFIFRTASSSAKSNREHSIPMLLYIIKKMIHFDEKGKLIQEKNAEHLSLVNNFAGQIQANLRFNFKSEFNNSAHTMKKIFEVCYYFYKICYKNDQELFLSQFYLFYDPVFSLGKQKTRDDSIVRLGYLSEIIVNLVEEERPEVVVQMLTRKDHSLSDLATVLEAFIQDVLSIVVSQNSQKSSIESLNIKIINDMLDPNMYIETVPQVIRAFVSLHHIMAKPVEESAQRAIKFILSFTLVSDQLLKKLLNSLEKAEVKESVVEAYDMGRYFESRKSLIKTANLLVLNHFSFDPKELEFFYRAFLNFIELGSNEYLELIKDFCLLALRSPVFPKDRSLLELINQFPAGVVKMSPIMADLHKYISSKQSDYEEDEEFDLAGMGETVVARYIEESIAETRQIEEIKKNLISILNLDFELQEPALLRPVIEAHKDNGQTAAIMFFPLLAKHHRATTTAVLLEVIKSNFELFYQSLISFSDIAEQILKEPFEHTDDLIKTFEIAFTVLLQTLQTKKSENSDKKINLLMLCVKSLSLLNTKSGSKKNKKVIIQLVFTLNDFLLGKIPQRFFEETVVKMIETDDLEYIQQSKASLHEEHREMFDKLLQGVIEKKKAVQEVEKLKQPTSAVGLKFQLKSFKKPAS